ncbi:MAG TPA: hypothetical protein VKM93_26005 [Terriglobia bacterium]|nr:hypothetical protein [Terriglobia bacterium]
MAEDYLEGLRQRGLMVIATGSEEKMDRAAEIMNRNGGLDTQEESGPERDLVQMGQMLGGQVAKHELC